MGASDAIVIGEAWISEHFFTTDAKSQSFLAKVVERRKAWDDADVETARSRFLAARGELESTLAGLSERLERFGDDAPEAAARVDAATARAELAADLTTLTKTLVGVLGFDRDGLVVDRDGPLRLISTPGLTGAAPLVIVEAWPVASPEALLAKDADTLVTPYVVDEAEADKPIRSAARLLSTLFVADDAPKFAFVLAGRWALVAEQERWAEGRYLAVDLQLVCERNDTKRGGEIDRALTCLCAESLAPSADGDIWWTATLEESVKHTVGVSQDLREGVRLSIEIIANEVVTRRREQGLDPLPADQAQPLAKQSLRFLYRILFLLYAEASPELGVLPVGAPEYQQGYSLDRLRNLTLVDLTTPRSRAGTHLYDSLDVLFRLVDRAPARERTTEPGVTEGLTFRQLRADLFKPEAVAHITDVKLGNIAVQQVLRHLLLSKESRSRDRGFISYAELGINQLGAVYEGLMSYTGFFAEEDLYEVAKGGDASKGSWVVPVDRAEGIAESNFVSTIDSTLGEAVPVQHQRGSFVYRLSGRDRQQSASYYTPEVLTRFTVGQALDELLGEKTEKMSAREILDLTICEPALGSGAFAIEAVRQLSERYLRKRQVELGETIDPNEYPKRLQEVKAYLALHQVYGVDLNATAVELAEVSLWLDTMGEGLEAPWFGLHLRRGNSLVGARRTVFRSSQLEQKTWLKDAPDDFPLHSVDTALLSEEPGAVLRGRIHSFLLPSEGWGSAVELKEGQDAKDLAPVQLERLKSWRRRILVKPTKAQHRQLADLAIRVEQLWQLAVARLRIAENEVRRSINVWGAEDLPLGGAVQREQIEAALADPGGAVGRLQAVMNAWCALWFWPLTVDDLPTYRPAHPSPATSDLTLDGWIDAIGMLLGRYAGKGAGQPGQERLRPEALSWDELGDLEAWDLSTASAMPIDRIHEKHPWLRQCDLLSAQHGFFHWELLFAPVFADRQHGFDLQFGNPPWVRPRYDVGGLLAEIDPWWVLTEKPSEDEKRQRAASAYRDPAAKTSVLEGTGNVSSLLEFLGSAVNYPWLTGLQPDLYRCFMSQSWRNASSRGLIALVHPETHFTDDRAGLLRSECYVRLRRHWQFINELRLFEDVHHLVEYGVHVYGSSAPVNFVQAASLYHPETVLRSLNHDGSGPLPGLKDDSGRWDLRPHAGRILNVTEEILKSWHSLLEREDIPVANTRMVYTVNESAASALAKMARVRRAKLLPLKFSEGWHESRDRRTGRFEVAWGAPSTWDDVILQGPHIHVAMPIYKRPNRTMSSNKDWSPVDLDSVSSSYIPTTSYKPAGSRDEYDVRYTDWGTKESPLPARDHYRLAWRNMAANTGERTLISALIPPGAAHIHGVSSVGCPESPDALITLAGIASSLLADFVIRAVPKSTISLNTLRRLPFPDHALTRELALRVLRLNCLTEAYAPLWSRAWDPSFVDDAWTDSRQRDHRCELGSVGSVWSEAVPLRLPIDRRQAMVEMDALVALIVGVNSEELCTVYRTQFAVLHGYDRNRDHYDANGRLVPGEVLLNARRLGDRLAEEDRTATNASGITYTYELPFRTLDREHDMRVAYAEFERRLQERS